jgi:glycosyltransferase involved in cell wall biosynthesis
MKLYWPTPEECEGNGYGYTIHARMMRQEVSKLIELTPDADKAMIITSCDKYLTKVPDKKNFLFSMFELANIPRSYAVNIQKAEHLIVPSNFCKDLFEQYYDGPISVCQEGVDADIFTYKKREFSEPFRFLWIGAPNPRKGYEEMTIISESVRGAPDIEIYLKTTVTGELKQYGNVIFDSRDITTKELVELYHSAHCFILPSRGEGWGLTLCEAMATGLPCIAPKHTGHSMFFSDYVGYPCKYEQKSVYEPNYELETKAYFPDTIDIIELMWKVYTHYDEALAKGKLASERIRNKFTWKQAAERMVRILEGVN